MASITAFLDVMEFESRADRTNAVAAALTTLLRHHWLGEKPLSQITATKSHAGKGTVAEFVRGSVGKADILYESIDWPMLGQFQRQVKLDPDLGVIIFDNVRLDSAGGREKFIRSAFIERFVTNAEVMPASPGAGEAISLPNKYLVVVNTNDGGTESGHSEQGSAHPSCSQRKHPRPHPDRQPQLEFLPKNRQRIEAELRGLIERWRVAGCPHETVNIDVALGQDRRGHPEAQRLHRLPWQPANTQGGGRTDRRAIGILGVVKPGKALRPAEWAQLGVQHGLVKTLIPANERDTDKGRERAMGVLLKPLIGETFE